MFTKELSAKLIKIIDERDLTVEALAEAAKLTREQLTNIKNGKSEPKLTSLEKICTALELNPNDLLLNEKSLQSDKSIPKPVTQILCNGSQHSHTYNALCPCCNHKLNSDWQSYCDNCGQRLSWNQYSKAELIFQIPDKKEL